MNAMDKKKKNQNKIFTSPLNEENFQKCKNIRKELEEKKEREYFTTRKNLSPRFYQFANTFAKEESLIA